MAGWRDAILREFTPGAAPLTLVADPDGLLAEEGVIQALQKAGFEIAPFEDSVAFRFIYESKYRPRWVRGEFTGLVITVQAPAPDLRQLPYDLLRAGRRLAFSLADLFPNLSYPVVAELDRGDLDALYEAQLRYHPGKLGNNATKDFILRHVCGIETGLVKEPEDLLHLLLRRHYRGQRMPRVLADRLSQMLRAGGRFGDWPLEEIVSNREAFFGFLQERWRPFLDRFAQGEGFGREVNPVAYCLAYPGPVELPFEHDDVRVYVDNLFVEGRLAPVAHPAAARLSSRWVAVGLEPGDISAGQRRFENLITAVEKALPGEDARHQEWLAFSRRWAELTALRFKESATGSPAEAERFDALRCRVDGAFLHWMHDRYAGLHNQPATPPVMLHHLPRCLARIMEKEGIRKVALIVVDGLAFDQWLVVRDVFWDHWPQFRFYEDAVFAWVPTLTSVSRQAIFAGKPPLFFSDSLYATDKEPHLWTLFWSDQGLGKGEAAYVKVSGYEKKELEEVQCTISYPKLSVIGIVVRAVDEIMHGVRLGTAGMHNQVRQWAETGYLAGLFRLLLDQRFEIYLTADHGNIEGSGCGVPAEGAVADLRGYRARIYPDHRLREMVRERFPGSAEWAPVGLPDDFLPLLAGGRSAFIPEGQKAVCHGGICIEEVIVPWVRVERIKGEVCEQADAGGFQPAPSA